MLIRNVIANYAGAVWVTFISMAFTPIYIRLLGLESYGLLGIFAVIGTIFGLFDLGMTSTLSREMARFSAGSLTGHGIRTLLRSIEIVMLCVGGIVILVVTGLSPWLATSWIKAETLPADVISFAVGLMGCAIALRFPEGLYRASLQGLQLQLQANILNSGVATLRAVGAWGVLVWIAPSIQIFFLWQIFVSLLSVLMNALILYFHLPAVDQPVRFSITSLRHIAKFSSGVMGITFLAILLTQVDKIILSRMLSLSDYAVYALAASVSLAIYGLVSPITSAFYPRMAQLLAEGDTIGANGVFHSGAKAVSVIGGSAALTIAIMADPVLKVWTDDAMLAGKAAPILTLLILGSLLNMMMQMPYFYQLALGRTRTLVITNIIAVVMIVPMLVIMTTSYGAVGGAAVWPILNLGYLFLSAPVIFRTIMPGAYGDWFRDDLVWPLSGPCMILLVGHWVFPDDSSRLVQAVIIASLASAALLISGLQAGYWPFIEGAIRRITRQADTCE